MLVGAALARAKSAVKVKYFMMNDFWCYIYGSNECVVMFEMVDCRNIRRTCSI